MFAAASASPQASASVGSRINVWVEQQVSHWHQSRSSSVLHQGHRDSIDNASFTVAKVKGGSHSSVPGWIGMMSWIVFKLLLRPLPLASFMAAARALASASASASANAAAEGRRCGSSGCYSCWCCSAAAQRLACLTQPLLRLLLPAAAATSHAAAGAVTAILNTCFGCIPVCLVRSLEVICSWQVRVGRSVSYCNREEVSQTRPSPTAWSYQFKWAGLPILSILSDMRWRMLLHQAYNNKCDFHNLRIFHANSN